MSVLIACEESGTIRDAFRRAGIEAWSCDILPSRGESRYQRYHYQCDIRDLLRGGRLYHQMALEGQAPKFDLLIAHPPCTYTTVAGARWIYEKPGRRQLQDEAIEFFRFLDSYEDIPRRCLEHPQSVVSTRYRPYQQVVRPYYFGDKETKQLCLYLTNLPMLQRTSDLKPPPGPARNWSMKDKAEWNKVHRMAPGPNRARDRSKTHPGFARAIVNQWGEYAL